MINKSQKIEINPSILKWTRESAGRSIIEVADKLDIPSSIISKWEKTPTKFQITTLRLLSSCFKRSFEVFLLNKPPKEAPPPKDFRLTGHKIGLSKENLRVIRKARRLQEITLNLRTNFKQNSRPKLNGAKVNEDPEKIAIKERKNFQVNLEVQSKWRDGYEAFRNWRDGIENRKINVFQFPLSEQIRGFSLVDVEPYIIVINSSDTIYARIFTLFHEYGHLILRTPGICDQTNKPLELYNYFKIEEWCNKFAGSFLMPKDYVSRMFAQYSEEKPNNYVSFISNRFKVSREALLLRLLKLNLVPKDYFNSQWIKIRSESRKPKIKKKILGRNMAIQCVSEKGRSFVSLVLENESKDHITYNQALDYLSIKSKTLEKISDYL